MVDTVKLYCDCESYIRRENENWQYTAPPQPLNAPGIYDPAFMESESINATKIFCNDRERHLYVSIQSVEAKEKDYRVRVSDNKGATKKHHFVDSRTGKKPVEEYELTPKKKYRVTVQTSLPKYLGQLSTETVKLESDIIDNVIEEVEQSIVKPVGRWKVSRIDVAPTLEMDFVAKGYLSALRQLSGSVNMYDRFFDDTVVYGNTQWQICHYDKLKEINARESVCFEGGRLLRAEARFLRSGKIKQIIGTTDWAELRKGNKLKKFSEEMISRILSFYQPADKVFQTRQILSYDQFEADIAAHVKSGKRAASFLREIALAVLSSHCSVDELRSTMIRSGVSERTAYRVAAEARKRRAGVGLRMVDGRELYAEFIEKLSGWCENELQKI